MATLKQKRENKMAEMLMKREAEAREVLNPLLDTAKANQTDALAAGTRLTLADGNYQPTTGKFFASLIAILVAAKAAGIEDFVAVDMTNAALGAVETLGEQGPDGKIKFSKAARTLKTYRSGLEGIAEAYFAPTWDDTLKTINEDRGEGETVATGLEDLSYREAREAIRLNRTSATRQQIKELRAALNAAITLALRAPQRANKEKGIVATEPASDETVIAWLSQVIANAPKRTVVKSDAAKPDATTLSQALEDAEAEDVEENEGGHSEPIRRSA